MRAALALARKDLTVTLRSPLLAIVSILVPVAFAILYAVVVHVSTTAPIVVADEDGTKASADLVRVMGEMHNADGPYYEILTTDPDRAKTLYTEREVGAMLTIPDGFEHALEERTGPTVTLSVVNISSDSTKNHHLRAEAALRLLQDDAPTAPPGRLTIEESTVLERDVPVSVYLGSALAVFTVLYAGMVTVGSGIAREWEDRTAKGLVLSPTSRYSLVGGKWLSGAATSLATTTITLLALGLVLGYPVDRLGWLSAVVLLTVWVYGAGLGTILGVALRRSLPLVPIAVITAVVHFLLCGYESYVRGFAHGGAVEALGLVTRWIPLTPLFDVVRHEVSSLPQPGGAAGGLVGSLTVAAVVVVVAARRTTRATSHSQGQ